MNTTTLKPPSAWVGGKSRLAKDIAVPNLNDHRLHVEVCLGALYLNVYAKKLPQNVKQTEVVNDINE